MKVGYSSYYHNIHGSIEFLVVSGAIHIIDQEGGYLGYTKSKDAAVKVCVDNGWKEDVEDIKEVLDYALENIIEQSPIASKNDCGDGE